MNKPAKKPTIRLSLLGVKVVSTHPKEVERYVATLALLRGAKGSQQTINRTTRLSDTRSTVGSFPAMNQPLRAGVEREFFKRSGLSRRCSGVKP